MKRTDLGRMAVAFSVLILVLTLPVASASATHPTEQSSPMLVPTTVCACVSSSSLSDLSSPEFRGHGPPIQNNQVNFDEQLGITFAQSFTSLEYNVTAVEQTDPTLDTGPAYLLNGLSNTGYWYQVGLSWNWGPGQNPGTGFDMNYEVFDPFGNSIYPAQGGGLQVLSGPVNPGDTVTLNIYFGNSNDVVMVIEDMNTGAFAEQTFSNEGGSSFVGLPDTVANDNGFFTGLMTEWYHGAPYYANPEGVAYSSNFSISSGWLWMDEFNPQNNQEIFAANASAPFYFTDNPSELQEFSYNSTTEYASATEFITGALNSTSRGGTGGTTTTGAPQVTMTFSYSVQGGGTGYSPPVLVYVSNGTSRSAILSTTPTGYSLDNGSQWSVSNTLPGSTSGERWVTNSTTSGTATDGATVSVQYQNQYHVTITVNDTNGGTVQPSSEWQNAGTAMQIVATPVQGWKFEGWILDNQSLAANSSSTTSVQVTGPTSEEAVFYPGLVVTTPGSVSVSYSFRDPTSGETGQGTVRPGTTQSIYLPPSSEVVLAANPTSFLYSGGWSIPGTSSSSQTVALSLLQPGSISAESSYNILAIAIIIGILVLVGVGLSVALTARKRAPTSDWQPPAPAQEPPAPPPSPPAST